MLIILEVPGQLSWTLHFSYAAHVVVVVVVADDVDYSYLRVGAL